MGKNSKEAKVKENLSKDDKLKNKMERKEVGHKRTRSTSKMLTYPGQEPPGQ